MGKVYFKKCIKFENKFIFVFFTYFLFSLYEIHSQPVFQWAKQFKGTGSDEGLCIKTDNAGNIYTAGYFWGLTDFDPGPGIDSLRAKGIDGFVTKFNSMGDLLWAKQIKGKSQETFQSIALDDSSNIYLTGQLSSNTDFDPGPGVYTLTPVSTNDIFILKLNSSGDFLWVKQIGGAWFQQSWAINTDINNNIYLTGLFSASIDFDPGPGTYPLNVIDGPINGFVLKLNSSGNFTWVKQFTGSSVEVVAVTVDPVGNVYTTGHFGGTSCDFDPGPMSYTLASQGNFEIFVHKMDAYGNFLWVKQLGSGNSDYASSICLDQYKHIYIAGYMGKSFIAKFDSLGSFVWSHDINIGSVSGLAMDGSDNVIGVGRFWGTSDFDPGPGIDSIKSSGDYDAFIVKLNSKGKYVCGAGMGGSDKDVATSVAIDNFQNICITGWFADTADFNPGVGTFNLISNAASNTYERGNVFVAKYSSCQVVTDFSFNNKPEKLFMVYPNPSKGKFKIKLSQFSSIEIVQVYDMLGRKIETNFEPVNNIVTIQSEPSGNYLLWIKTENEILSEIIVVE